jgi:hypothetical protein
MPRTESPHSPSAPLPRLDLGLRDEQVRGADRPHPEGTWPDRGAKHLLQLLDLGLRESNADHTCFLPMDSDSPPPMLGPDTTPGNVYEGCAGGPGSLAWRSARISKPFFYRQP